MHREESGLGKQEGGMNAPNQPDTPKGRYEERGTRLLEWNMPCSVTFKSLTK